MITAANRPLGHGEDGEAPPTPHLSLVVGRALGTVVVTVEGALDLASCRRLEVLLLDLIEGQGNLAVAIDLTRATVEPEAMAVFVDAGRRASFHRARFILKGLPPDAHRALVSSGLSELVEVTGTVSPTDQAWRRVGEDGG